MNPSIINHLTDIAAGHHSLAGYLTSEQTGDLFEEFFELHSKSENWMSFQHNSAVGFVHIVVDAVKLTMTYYAVVIIDCVAYTVVLITGADGLLKFDDANDFLPIV